MVEEQEEDGNAHTGASLSGALHAYRTADRTDECGLKNTPLDGWRAREGDRVIQIDRACG